MNNYSKICYDQSEAVNFAQRNLYMQNFKLIEIRALLDGKFLIKYSCDYEIY